MVTACLEHEVVLAERCPRCGTPVSTATLFRGQCDCGERLAEFGTPSVPKGGRGFRSQKEIQSFKRYPTRARELHPVSIDYDHIFYTLAAEVLSGHRESFWTRIEPYMRVLDGDYRGDLRSAPGYQKSWSLLRRPARRYVPFKRWFIDYVEPQLDHISAQYAGIQDNPSPGLPNQAMTGAGTPKHIRRLSEAFDDRSPPGEAAPEVYSIEQDQASFLLSWRMKRIMRKLGKQINLGPQDLVDCEVDIRRLH